MQPGGYEVDDKLKIPIPCWSHYVQEGGQKQKPHDLVRDLSTWINTFILPGQTAHKGSQIPCLYKGQCSDLDSVLTVPQRIHLVGVSFSGCGSVVSAPSLA